MSSFQVLLGRRRWSLALYSDRGQVRARNEDNIATMVTVTPDQPARLFAAVADGVASHPDGDIASRQALLFARQELVTAVTDDGAETLRQLIEQANLRLFIQHTDTRQAVGPSLNDAQTPVGTFGSDSAHLPATTLVAALIGEIDVVVGNLGDSRAYHYGAEGLQQVSQDHVTNDRERLLTQCLGVELIVEPAIQSVAMQSGELLLLCSDGLTKGVSEQDITAIIRSNLRPDAIHDLVLALGSRANQDDGSDNISIIALHCADVYDGPVISARQINPQRVLTLIGMLLITVLVIAAAVVMLQ